MLLVEYKSESGDLLLREVICEDFREVLAKARELALVNPCVITVEIRNSLGDAEFDLTCPATVADKPQPIRIKFWRKPFR